MTLEVVQAQAFAAADASHDFMGRGGKPTPIGPVFSAGIGHDTFARERLVTMFKLVMAGVGLVLLLACANAAKLLLARAAGRLAAVPGVESVGFGWTTAFLPMRSEQRFRVQGGDDTQWTVASNRVSSDFFTTMGIPLVAGRTFTPAEAEDALGPAATRSPAIISERLAREAFPNGGAIGSRLALEFSKGKVLEIVGIVGDVRSRPITNDPEPWLYLPADEVAWGRVFVRSSVAFPHVAATVRDVTRTLNPLMPPHDLEPLAASVDRVLAEQRVLARVSALPGSRRCWRPSASTR